MKYLLIALMFVGVSFGYDRHEKYCDLCDKLLQIDGKPKYGFCQATVADYGDHSFYYSTMTTMGIEKNKESYTLVELDLCENCMHKIRYAINKKRGNQNGKQ